MQYPVSTEETGMDREDRAVFKGVDDLLPDVKYILPKCDAEITIRKTLAEKVQEFCRATHCLQTAFDLTVVTGQRTYEIPVGDVNADLLNVREVGVWRNSTADTALRKAYELTPRHDFQIDDPLEEDAVYLVLAAPLTAPTDGTSAVIRVYASLLPYFDQSIGTQAYSLPDKWLRRWRQAIVAGTVARLASMENRAWSNAGLAKDMQNTYNLNVVEAYNKADINHMAGGSGTCVNSTGFV